MVAREGKGTGLVALLVVNDLRVGGLGKRSSIASVFSSISITLGFFVFESQKGGILEQWTPSLSYFESYRNKLADLKAESLLPKSHKLNSQIRHQKLKFRD